MDLSVAGMGGFVGIALSGTAKLVDRHQMQIAQPLRKQKANGRQSHEIPA